MVMKVIQRKVALRARESEEELARATVEHECKLVKEGQRGVLVIVADYVLKVPTMPGMCEVTVPLLLGRDSSYQHPNLSWTVSTSSSYCHVFVLCVLCDCPHHHLYGCVHSPFP